MEACINAKESAGSPDARIHMQFHAGENSLAARVRVEQPGRNEQMLSQPSAAMWNLKLLNTLMDDVRIIDGQMGRELVMIKYLRNTMPMAGAG
jgi:hypothetical protein